MAAGAGIREAAMRRAAAGVAAVAATRFDREIDVRGLTCPMPALRARLALARMSSGEVLRVVATDRESPRDFERFAAATGHALIARGATRGEFVFYLRKK
jgi:tRNA 2-thiouridine synthesizing protein A